MKLVDKLKTITIGALTAALTSCGFKSNKAQIIERNPAASLMPHGCGIEGQMYSCGIEEQMTDITNSVDNIRRQELAEKIKASGISIEKTGENGTDSLLVSVEEGKDGKFHNPQYGFNPSKEIQVKEKIPGGQIVRNNQTTIVKKFDGSTFGGGKYR